MFSLIAVSPGARALTLTTAYFAVVFTAGALLAPAVYLLLQSAKSIFPALATFADQPFHRYVNRSLLAAGLIGLIPFVRLIGIQSFGQLGLGRSRSAWQQWTNGLTVGFGSLACAACLTVLAGARQFEPHSAGKLIEHLANALLAAATVSVLEELFFRGALQTALCRALPPVGAVLLSSVIYAWLHFFQRPPPPAEVTWTTGFIVLGQMFSGLADTESLIPALLSLTMAGVILGVTRQQTGLLYFPIGLHAGWIFWLKSYGFLTEQNGPANLALWGSRKLIDGWIAFFVLLGTLAFVMLAPSYRMNRPRLDPSTAR